jgi:RNA polymerase sigma-70 factor (ECF subfamily)
MTDRPATTEDLSVLIAAARDGNAQAADRLWEGVRPRLLRAALAMGVDSADAADLVQETLWSAHRNLRRFDASRASFQGWLGVILVRRAGNRWRSLLRHRRLLIAWGFSASTSEPAGSRAVEARLTLQRLLDRLSRRQREVVALYEIAGLSAQETADALGISAAGVRSTARDARRRLTEEASRDAREALP